MGTLMTKRKYDGDFSLIIVGLYARTCVIKSVGTENLVVVFLSLYWNVCAHLCCQKRGNPNERIAFDCPAEFSNPKFDLFAMSRNISDTLTSCAMFTWTPR